MTWKVFFSTFALIFLAEIGDKTQLAVLSFVAKTRSPLSVLLGASSALLLATLIAVCVGDAVTRVVPESVLRYVSGGLFVLFGALILWGR